MFYLVSSASLMALANATVHSQRFLPQVPGSSWQTAVRWEVTESSTSRISYVDKWLHSLKAVYEYCSKFKFESYLSLVNSKTSLTLMEFKASSVHIIKCWSFTSEGRGFKSSLETMTSILIKFECRWHWWKEMELEINQSVSSLKWYKIHIWFRL